MLLGTRGILKCNIKRALECMRSRLGYLDSANKFSQEVLFVEGANECFDFHDQGAINQERDHSKGLLEQQCELEEFMKGKGIVLFPAINKAKYKITKIPLVMDQPTASQMLPPKGHIWRGYTRSEWCGDITPYSIITAPDRKFPSAHDGCLHVIRSLWRIHFATNPGTVKDCPIEGLFAD